LNIDIIQNQKLLKQEINKQLVNQQFLKIQKDQFENTGNPTENQFTFYNTNNSL